MYAFDDEAESGFFGDAATRNTETSDSKSMVRSLFFIVASSIHVASGQQKQARDGT